MGLRGRSFVNHSFETEKGLCIVMRIAKRSSVHFFSFFLVLLYWYYCIGRKCVWGGSSGTIVRGEQRKEGPYLHFGCKGHHVPRGVTVKAEESESPLLRRGVGGSTRSVSTLVREVAGGPACLAGSVGGLEAF